jgi:hypothetical protein
MIYCSMCIVSSRTYFILYIKFYSWQRKNLSVFIQIVLSKNVLLYIRFTLRLNEWAAVSFCIVSVILLSMFRDWDSFISLRVYIQNILYIPWKLAFLSRKHLLYLQWLRIKSTVQNFSLLSCLNRHY